MILGLWTVGGRGIVLKRSLLGIGLGPISTRLVLFDPFSFLDYLIWFCCFTLRNHKFHNSLARELNLLLLDIGT